LVTANQHRQNLIIRKTVCCHAQMRLGTVSIQTAWFFICGYKFCVIGYITHCVVYTLPLLRLDLNHVARTFSEVIS